MYYAPTRTNISLSDFSKTLVGNPFRWERLPCPASHNDGKFVISPLEYEKKNERNNKKGIVKQTKQKEQLQWV